MLFNRAWLLCVLFLLPNGATAEMFLRFDGITGGSQDPDYAGWSDLNSMNLVIERPDPRGASELTAARFSMGIDLAYPSYIQAAVNGQLTPRVEVDLVVDGLRTIAYEFDDVTIVTTSTNHGVSGPGSLTMFFDIPRIMGEFFEYDTNGMPMGSSSFVWNFDTGTGNELALPGDYDADGDVDLDDLGVWQDEFNSVIVNVGTGSDGNADGLVDAADYTIWRDAYNEVLSIPEPQPTTFGLLVFLNLVVKRLRRR